jgi:hypothetical protein
MVSLCQHHNLDDVLETPVNVGAPGEPMKHPYHYQGPRAPYGHYLSTSGPVGWHIDKPHVFAITMGVPINISVMGSQ